MRIYSLILLAVFCGLAVRTVAYAAGPQEFLLSHKLPPEIFEKINAANKSINQCLVVEKYLVCIQGKLFPGVNVNAQARQAVLSGLNITTRNSLYNFASYKTKSENLKNQAAVIQTVNEGQNKGLFKLKKLEFTSFCKDNWCAAIALIPADETIRELSEIYKSCSFINAYCYTLFPDAMSLMERGKYKDALYRLKEMHDLKFADINAYILACRAFIMDSQPKEAEKIAQELLKDFSEKMNSVQAEELGDIFVTLKQDAEAEKAYKLASDLLVLSAE